MESSQANNKNSFSGKAWIEKAQSWSNKSQKHLLQSERVIQNKGILLKNLKKERVF